MTGVNQDDDFHPTLFAKVQPIIVQGVMYRGATENLLLVTEGYGGAQRATENVTSREFLLFGISRTSNE